ncbi:MAG TPA: HNH endonuclease signature motif containing protein, partial [Acidimicrobiales bacterium]
RAVEARDRHCRGPGCHLPAHHCDIDHIWRHSDGGPTHPDNGQALCSFHNHQREPTTPPPPAATPPRAATPPDTPTSPGPGQPDPRALARLELARKRIRDRYLHDPHWAA